MTDTDSILARLDEFNRLVASRDLGIVDLLDNPQGFALFGSEAGEHAQGPGLRPFFAEVFAKPYTITFVWHDPAITFAGDIAWVTAEGTLHLGYSDRVTSMPFRLVAIFQKQGGDWRWRLFSGSEPAPSPSLD